MLTKFVPQVPKIGLQYTVSSGLIFKAKDSLLRTVKFAQDETNKIVKYVELHSSYENNNTTVTGYD